MIAFIDNPECLKNIMHFAVFVLIILVFGFIGGLGRASLESIKDSNFKPDGTKGFIKHGILGITGAGVFVFIAILLSKYNGEKFTAADVLFFTCISTSGGVLALGIIDAFAEKVKNDWLKMENKMRDIEAQNKKIEQISKNYSAILADADVVLRKESVKRDIAEIALAIGNMEEAKHIFKTDRVFSIRLGRLYRAMFEKTDDSNYLDKAIIALRKYIDAMEQSGKNSVLDKKNMASAYFNIACYHSLKIVKSESQMERLTSEAISALKQSITFDPNLKEEISDTDLDNIRKSEMFKKTFDEESMKCEDSVSMKNLKEREI